MYVYNSKLLGQWTQAYWLACPTNTYGDYDLWIASFETRKTAAFHVYQSMAFRPVVCLKSSVVLTWNSETNQYDLT